MITVVSAMPDTRVFPSGAKASDRTALDFGSGRRTSRFVAISQIRIVVSQPLPPEAFKAAARDRTSGERAGTASSSISPNSGPPGDPGEDAMQPRPQRLPAANHAGLQRQDQEGRLEGVLHGVLISHRAAADAPDHRPVTPDDPFEGALGRGALAVAEPTQQLAIAQAADGALVVQHADVANEAQGYGTSHRESPCLGP
jgi:hypothetical protein